MKMTRKLSHTNHIDLVTITMTAELADAYRTKREGVNHILTQVEQTFPTTPKLVLDVETKLRTLQEARAEPLKVASANWAATGWMISLVKENCVIVDVGSTTTSIIPIVKGAISAESKNDLEKLINGELVYTGSLRTNVAATVNTIPVNGCIAGVSSELFAQSADVHLILGNITEKEYTVETADCRDKTRNAALARLARVVCADSEMLSEKEIVGMAQYVYERQVEHITEALAKVYNRLNNNGAIPAVVTGIGRNFLARKAALQLGVTEVIDFAELANGDVARVSTAFAVALIGACTLEGRVVRWTQ